MAQYKAFKDTADRPNATPPSRVELLFLAAYHLIDACAAKRGQHINKHQNVRLELERNPVILGDRTDRVWRALPTPPRGLSAQVVYGGPGGGQGRSGAPRSFSERGGPRPSGRPRNAP